MIVNFKKIHPDAKIPVKAHANGDAGYDLFALEYVTLNPFERRCVRTGLVLEIPDGYYGRIAPRSGLAVKKGIDVLAGVIDSNYRDEIGVVLINLECWPVLLGLVSSPAETLKGMTGIPGQFSIKPGDRIAQIIFEKCHDVDFVENNVGETERKAGFGSTGV